MSLLVEEDESNGRNQKNLRQTSKLEQEYETIQREMIQTSLRKSYIYQMSGSKRKIFSYSSDKKDQNKSLLKSKLVKNLQLEKIEEDEEKEEEVKEDYFMVSNIGRKKNEGFNCCSVDRPILAEIKVTEEKEVFFTHPETQILIYALNFNTVYTELDSGIQNEGYFIINVSEDVIIKVENKSNKKHLKSIYKNLSNIIKRSIGKSYQMNDLKTVQGFQTRKYKPAIQFIEHCQTGDILLFKGSHFFANIQRFFTNSQYDHVGMVIRDPVYGILIFESNSSSGVCLTPWEFVVKYKWYEAIERIVWRRLKSVERGMKFQDLIHQFVLANIGKNYYISMNKLLSNRSFIAQSSEEVGYFCSELVAAIYKDLGLLTRDENDPDFKPGCNFYPYHFTQKHDLKLKKGSLSDEYILHFHEQSLAAHYKT